MKRSLPHTFVRKGTFYFNRRVPTRHLKHPFFNGSPFYRACLYTSEWSLAVERLRDEIARFDGIIADLDAGLNPNTPATTSAPQVSDVVVDRAFVQFHARRKYDAILGEDMKVRLAAGASEDHADLDRLALDDQWSFDESQKRRGMLMQRLVSAVADDVDAIFSRYGVIPHRTDPAYQEVAQALIEAELEAMEVIASRISTGVLLIEPRSPVLKDAPTELKPANRMNLAQLTKRYLEVNPSVSYDWRKRLDAATTLFKSRFGDIDIKDITKRQIRDFADDLKRYPLRGGLRFRGLGMMEAIAKNEARPKPFQPVDASTIQYGYLAPLKRLLTFAHDREMIDINVGAGISVEAQKGRKLKGRGTEFRYDELNALFRLASYLDPAVPDHLYWAPLIALFSGARSSEIAQIKLSEIHILHKAPHFQIQTSDDGRQLKTAAATREVPIHPELFKLGFDGYVAKQVAAGKDRLFTEWQKPNNKRYSDDPSIRKFSRMFVPEISNRTDPKPNFHSFRHTIKAQMRICGLHPQFQDQILGHEGEGMDAQYGRNARMPIEIIAPEFAKVTYPEVDLRHLHRKAVRRT